MYTQIFTADEHLISLGFLFFSYVDDFPLALGVTEETKKNRMSASSSPSQQPLEPNASDAPPPPLQKATASPSPPTRMHNLENRLPVGYFFQDLVHREEERVSHDMIKCCAELEARGWPHLNPSQPSRSSWQSHTQRLSIAADTAASVQQTSSSPTALPVLQSINGYFQHFVEQPLHKLAGERPWRDMNVQLSQTVSKWIAVVGHVLKQQVSLDDLQTAFDDALDVKQRTEQHIVQLACASSPSTSSPPSTSGIDTASLDFVTVGNSRLVVDEAIMVHVWTNPRSARNFVNLWSRVWQAIFEHRIVGIHCPFSAMFCIQGEYVSVTALPPLQLMNQTCSYYPSLDCANDGLLSYSAARLARALLLPTDVPFPLINAKDGHFYLVSIEVLLVKEHQIPGFDGVVIRRELLHRQLFAAGASSSTSSTTPSVAAIPSAVYLRESAIPQLVDYLLGEVLLSRQDEQLQPSRLVSDHVLRDSFHRFGVNMNLLYYVLRQAKLRRGKIAAASRHSKAAVGSKSPQSTNNGGSKAVYEALQCLVYSEMVGRVLKQFARADMIIHNSLGKRTEADRLDVVNRITMYVMGKSPTFWTDHVMPAIREKFAPPKDFTLSFEDISPAAALKVMTLKIGCEFSLELLRFVRFNTVTGIWPAFVDPVRPVKQVASAVNSSTKRASPEPGGVKLRSTTLQLVPIVGTEQRHDGDALAKQCLAAAEQFPVASIARQTFLFRACTIIALRSAAAGVGAPVYDRMRKALAASVAELKVAEQLVAADEGKSKGKGKGPAVDQQSSSSMTTLRPEAVAKVLTSTAKESALQSSPVLSPYASGVLGGSRSFTSRPAPLNNTIPPPPAGVLDGNPFDVSTSQLNLSNTYESSILGGTTATATIDELATSVAIFFTATGATAGTVSDLVNGKKQLQQLGGSGDPRFSRGVVVVLEACLVDAVAAEMVPHPSCSIGQSPEDVFDRVITVCSAEAHADGKSHGALFALLLRAVASAGWGLGSVAPLSATGASASLWMIPRLLVALRVMDDKASWVDLYACDASEGVLRLMEESLPSMTSEQASEAAKIISEVYTMHSSPARNRRATVGIPYAARALRALVMSTKSCELGATLTFADRLIRDSLEELGPESELTIGFYYCYAASASAAAKDASRMLGAQRLIVRADTAPLLLGDGVPACLSIARSAPTNQLMLNVQRELTRRGAAGPAGVVHQFVLTYGKWYCALLAIQTVGRGYLDRSLIRRWQLVLQHRREAAAGDAERKLAALVAYLNSADPDRVPEAPGLLAKYNTAQKLQQLALIFSEKYGGDSADILTRVLLSSATYAARANPVVGGKAAPAYAADFLRMYISDVGTEMTVGGVHSSRGQSDDELSKKQPSSTVQFVSSAAAAGGGGGANTASTDANLEEIVKRVFLLCDRDGDGLVTANACFSMIEEMKIMRVDELRSMFVAKHGGRLINFLQFKEMVLFGTIPDGIVGGNDLSPAYYGKDSALLPPLAYPKKAPRAQKLPLLRQTKPR